MQEETRECSMGYGPEAGHGQTEGEGFKRRYGRSMWWEGKNRRSRRRVEVPERGAEIKGRKIVFTARMVSEEGKEQLLIQIKLITEGDCRKERTGC